MAPKTLLVFCDGTGMDGSLAPSTPAVSAVPTKEVQGILGLTNTPITRGLTRGLSDTLGVSPDDIVGFIEGDNTQYATNVLHLARSVKNLDANGHKQIVFYQSGVGSESNFTGDPIGGTTAMQALGTAVASKVRDAYVFIAQNFEDGDEICLFGFSRGAYTARKLSGLIDSIGLLTRENLSHFFEIWRQLVDKETPAIPADTRRPSIKCVGVWDTVGSVYKEIDALDISDTTLPATVKVALHAVSLQENRKRFLPTLWSIPSGGLKSDQVLKQVWFPGAHSDVGGGYERRELADISLFWMAGEISSMGLVNIDLDFLRSWAQARPEPWGTTQPHNTYLGTPAVIRPIIGRETRLQNKDITQQSVFHESVKYSPQKLDSPFFMITMSMVQQSLGSGFAPQYPPLNEFEQYCKDHWGTGLREGMDQGAENPVTIVKPVRWTPRQSGLVPNNTITGGRGSDGKQLYVARAPYEGGIHPGQFDGEAAHISYEGKEIVLREGFDLLVGRQAAVRWATVSGKFSFNALSGAVPVQGGSQADGEIFYVAQARISSAVYPGKVKVDGNALIPYAGGERVAESYSVLVFV